MNPDRDTHGQWPERRGLLVALLLAAFNATSTVEAQSDLTVRPIERMQDEAPELPEEPAGEIATELPPFPRAENMVELDRGLFEGGVRVFLDSEALSQPAPDVVRYTILLVSSAGTGNLFYESSNCDRDVHHVLMDTGHEPTYVWHEHTIPDDTEALILPGGFSYGDRLRAGATVPLRVALRDSEGRTTIEALRLTLPPHVTGPVQLLVADAARAGQRDLAAGDHPRSARTLPQLIRTLNGLRRNDRVYVRLIALRRGAVVGGEPLPGLPASVLAVVQGDRAGGDVSDLHDVTVGTWEIATDRVVTGSRLLSLTVEAG